MDITLHQATEQVRALLDQIDPDTGEMPAEFEQARAIVATKAVAVTAYILETERQAGMLRDYAKEVLSRASTADARIKWLKNYLVQHMAVCGITEIKDTRGIFKATLAIGRDEAIEIFDESQIPRDYFKEIPATEQLDKALVKKAIKDGFEVPGAVLVKRDRLTIK